MRAIMQQSIEERASHVINTSLMGFSLLNLDISITKLLLMSFLFDNFLGCFFSVSFMGKKGS